MKFNPHPYQQYAIDRVVSDPAVGLFLEPGLGKTVITLTAIQELKFNRWQVMRPLVVAPKKVAEATWSSEAAKWDHLKALRVVPILGTEKQRINALYSPGDVWVINRENVPWLADYCRNEWSFDMVVLDESTSFKNSRSKRFMALKRMRPRINRLVELTGTPSPNGMEDLYAQVYLLDGGVRLGRTLTSFRESFMSQDYAHPGQQYRTYSMLPGADGKIRAAISDICISMKTEDYLTLPDYIEDVVPVALDAAAKKAYMKLEREMLLQVDTETITAGSAVQRRVFSGPHTAASSSWVPTTLSAANSAAVAQSGATHRMASSSGMPITATIILCVICFPLYFIPPTRRSRC